MNALKSTTLLSLLLVVVTGTVQAADTPAPMYKPLRPISSCIRTDRINEWHIVDGRTAIVRNGPRRYLVKLQNDCPRLGIGPQGLIFRANESNQLTSLGRICGEAGESVRSRDQPPCAIRSVRIIDKPTFDKLSVKASRHGNGAEPNGNKP